MRTYSFGNPEKPVLLLLPGTCCHWRTNFSHVIPLLTPDFHVVCLSYDGFDETEGTVFPDMLTEVQRIEEYINHKHGGYVHGVYGCSLGGSFVGLLAQRGNIRMGHGMLGSSDLDQDGGAKAGVLSWLLSLILCRMMRTGKIPAFFQKRLAGKPSEQKPYFDKMLALFSQNLRFVRRRSIYNQFHSDLITPLDAPVDSHGAAIHCFYAKKMGDEYLRRYNRHFPQAEIRTHDLLHEELLLCYPQQWAAEVRACCKD